MRSFSGRLPEADRSIVGAALLSLRTSLNCEMALFNRDEFNVEPLLGPSARDRPRNTCGRGGRNYWHDPAEHGSDPELANLALDSMDARCNRGVAFIFLVVCERPRVAAEHAGSPKARSACAIAVEARVDMGADCRNTRHYRHDRDGVRDGASGAIAAGGVRRANGFLKVWSADSDLRDCLY